MKIFTDEEELALESTDKKYKWIARDESGDLYLYEMMPYRDENVFYSDRGDLCFACNKCFSDVLFSNVTWENSPIQYRNYDE